MFTSFLMIINICTKLIIVIFVPFFGLLQELTIILFTLIPVASINNNNQHSHFSVGLKVLHPLLLCIPLQLILSAIDYD